MVRIYTRSGDEGDTSLFGGGRVPKNHVRLDAYGTLDELNALLGLVRVRSAHDDLKETLVDVQSRLFDIGAHLATPPDAEKARTALPHLDESLPTELEQVIDRLEDELEPLTTFILPGGNVEAATLHVARTVCRRAERATAAIPERDTLHPVILTYLNRLSDLLFVMARVVVARAGDDEDPWVPGSRPARK